MPLNFPVQMIQGLVVPEVVPFWVDVNDAGNDAFDYLASYNTFGETAGSDANNSGDVPYNYQISTYAIRVSYIDIYNAAPENSTKQLPIGNDAGYPNNPVVGVTWNNVARFVNWLNEREGEQPAYNFTTGGVNDNISLWDSASAWQNGGENLYRHKNARYFLPSWDEYLKACYYDPNHGGVDVPGYWKYPQGISTAPTAVPSGTSPGTAVYNQSGTDLDDQRAPVDNCGGVSPYGCMGMGGNSYEYLETSSNFSNDSGSAQRILNGGTATTKQTFALAYMSIGGYLPYSPGLNPATGGFRIARAPVGTGEDPFPADPGVELLFNEFDVEAETTPNTGSLNTQPNQDAYSLFQSTVINNGVVTFDGAGDHINIPGSLPSFTNGSGTDSPFSISCWVKSAEAIGSDQVIIAKQTSGAYEWALSYTTTGEVNIILSTTDLTSGSIEATSTSTFTQNVWQHVLVTYDGTKDETGLKIYIDGTLETVTAVENGTYTGMSDTISSAYIGRRPIGLTNASDEFEGDMDNMRIYYRLLAGEEIAALFAEGHD